MKPSGSRPKARRAYRKSGFHSTVQRHPGRRGAEGGDHRE